MALIVPALPPPLEVASGYRYALDRMVGSGVVFLGVFPGTQTTTSYLFIISGIYVRIFEGFNATYLYNTPSGIISSSGFEEWNTVANYANVVTQIDSSQVTVLFKNLQNITTQVLTQKLSPPDMIEKPGEWVLDTTLSGMVISDAVGEPDALVSNGLPLLAGNNRLNQYPRIYKSFNRSRPINTFTKSDTGIPQQGSINGIAQITDLEAV